MKPAVMTARQTADFLGMSYERFDMLREEDIAAGTPGESVPAGFRFTPKGHWRYIIEDVKAWLYAKSARSLETASTSVTESAHT